MRQHLLDHPQILVELMQPRGTRILGTCTSLAAPTLAVCVALHAGFAKAADAVHGDLRAQGLLQIVQKTRLTGHSLGGAVAVILGAYLSANGFSLDQIITFDQPKVTDARGLVKLKAVLDKAVRVAACDDVISLVPYFTYRHGASILLPMDMG